LDYGLLVFLALSFFSLWVVFRKSEKIEAFYEKVIGQELSREDIRGGKGKVRLFIRIMINLLPFSPSEEYLGYWKRKLMQAGYPDGWQSGMEFFILRLFHAGIGLLLASFSGHGFQDYLVLGSLGFYFPAAVIRAKILHRRKRAKPSFRKMLKLLEVNLEQGTDLKESIQIASKAIESPLCEVFQSANRRMEEDEMAAFAWLSDQFDFPELKKFCILVSIAQANGTPILEVVREMIKNMDERVQNDIDAAIGSAKLKITFSMIFLTVLPFSFAVLFVMGITLVNMFK
jgi:Flp pilus assembly protein TadB